MAGHEAEHSPMGGSRAACFIKCPGSVSLGAGLADVESDYAAEGTLAHEVAANCLSSGIDAWELMDESKGIDQDMVNAVQVYLDDIRRFWDGEDGGFVEEEFRVPEFHKHFRGFVDFSLLFKIQSGNALRLWDYKHGAGIVVEVEDNAQLKYYGTGMILALKKSENIDIEKVFFTIVQPRAFHPDGPVRRVVYTRQELFDWAENVLRPAMEKAETSTETVSGEHCRFCPVRFRKCPALEKDMEALEKAPIKEAEEQSDEEIGNYLELFEKAKIKAKAMKTLAFQRMQAGRKIPGFKLVTGQSNRTWKEGAEAALEKEYKAQAFTKPVLLSPAQIEKLPNGSKWTAQYAFKPDAGLTVVPTSDRRKEVSTDTKSLFTPVKEKI